MDEKGALVGDGFAGAVGGRDGELGGCLERGGAGLTDGDGYGAGGFVAGPDEPFKICRTD